MLDGSQSSDDAIDVVLRVKKISSDAKLAPNCLAMVLSQPRKWVWVVGYGTPISNRLCMLYI